MRRPFYFTGPFSLVLVLWGSLSFASQKSWVEIRSAHFIVVTDDGARRGQEVALHFERMRTAFGSLMKAANLSGPAPLTILALSNGKELEHLLGSKPNNSPHAGIFIASADENFILVDVSSPDCWHAVFHEYAHELLNANTSADTQTWFDEGFAEYFSTIQSRNDSAAIGLVPLQELQFLRDRGKLLPLQDLFAVNPGTKIYRQPGELQSIFYAESWLLVHFLFDRQLINKAQSFFSLAAAGDLQTATLRAFGTPLPELEQQFLAYAKGEQFRYFRIPSREPVVRFEQREIPTDEVEALETEVRWHSTRNSEDAATGYSRILKTYPRNLRALRGLGSVLINEGAFGPARDYLELAAAVSSTDVLTHYYLAELEYQQSRRRDAASTQAIKALVREARLCTLLLPSFADAYRLLGSGEARSGDINEARAAFRQAAMLAPRLQPTTTAESVTPVQVQANAQLSGSAVSTSAVEPGNAVDLPKK